MTLALDTQHDGFLMNVASDPSFDDATSNVPRLRHRRVGVMVCLFVISLNCYAFYWYVETTRALNRRTTDKISSGFMALCIGTALTSITLILTLKVLVDENVAEGLRTALWALKIGDSGLWLAWTLRLRRRFNDYMRDLGQPGLSAGLLGSVLLHMFYLQFKINQSVDDRLVRGAAPL